MKLRNLPLITSLVLAGMTISTVQADTSKPVANAPEVTNIVLVHGLFADASSWSKVIPLLQAKGLHVTGGAEPDDVTG
ncbi:alpha/beta hydrolase [Rahnella victoriana]|uniref:alpha/beta hydrolase n=1 Tax=Rahnella victoriana TaxID=1510570 RepID=UPI001F454849|nr:alpha/beta hydrolase [Rahnella victoriana]